MAKLIPKPKMSASEALYVPEIAKGLRVTIGRFLQNTFSARGSEGNEIDTVDYQEEKRVYTERFLGLHRLTHRADSLAALRGVLVLQHGVSSAVHPHRSGRIRAGRPALRLRALPQCVRYRRAALHLLRLLCRSVPMRCDSHGHRHPHAAFHRVASTSSSTRRC